MKPNARFAFTLLELLVVIAIIGVLSALVVPAIHSVMHGSRLTQGSEWVVVTLNQARQAALTTNHPVEIRFYRYLDPETPGENAPAPGKFRALQSFEYRDDGSAIALGKVQKLPSSVIIDASSALSSLLTVRKEWGRNANGEENSPSGIPVVGNNYQCSAFRFLPDGSTNLPATPGALWFVTLHSLKDGDNRTVPPPNYATIKIDPVNGSLKVYRP